MISFQYSAHLQTKLQILTDFPIRLIKGTLFLTRNKFVRIVAQLVSMYFFFQRFDEKKNHPPLVIPFFPSLVEIMNVPSKTNFYNNIWWVYA
jgi:hypothetical protein